MQLYEDDEEFFDSSSEQTIVLDDEDEEEDPKGFAFMRGVEEAVKIREAEEDEDEINL
ncbi:hypothetical protein HQ545_00315 [Candidatus Woesearchaeota archaeon]|nr:hypothetical protein [Candidatus Woesearchaeota archaeon]